MPQLSIVIPLYNKGPHIARAIDSVLAQTFGDYEVIVVDDGSTDDGAKIVSGYSDKRIRLVSQENQGVSAARNRGVGEATTNFIAFLDADDQWMPKHLETIQRLRSNYPDAGMYVTTFRMKIADNNVQVADYRFIPDSPWEGIIPDFFKTSAYGDNPANASVIGIPRDKFLQVGGFSRGYWFGEDHDLFGRIALKYPVAFSWELGGIYYKDAVNRACNRPRELLETEPFVISARKALVSGDVLPERIESLTEYLYKLEIWRAAKNVQVGDRKTAMKILRQCKTRWFSRMKYQWMLLAILPYPVFHLLQDQKRKVFR